jgi:hypothetical protein
MFLRYQPSRDQKGDCFRVFVRLHSGFVELQQSADSGSVDGSSDPQKVIDVPV